jgi:transcriptional regulator with XRE-family HTH domain
MPEQDPNRPEADDMEVGQRLELLLDRIRMTQTALGERCGKNLQYVNNIIRRGQRITQEFAAAVREETGVNLNWLYTGQGAMMRDESDPPPQAPPIPDDFDTTEVETNIREAAEDLLDAAEKLTLLRDAQSEAADILNLPPLPPRD